MGNTEFYKETSNLEKNFKWGDIFSDVSKPHTQEDRDKLIVSGCTSYMPTEATMLKEWRKPWLFARFFLVGVVLVALMYGFQYIALSDAIIAMLMFVPAFIAPITILLFFWEMNIPRNISLLDLMKYVLFAGATSCTLTFIIRDIMLVSYDTRAYIAAPIPEELAKFILVFIIIKKLNCKYILNGLLIGASVGAGFAAIESAGYAFGNLFSYGSLTAMHSVNLLRAVLAIGGHSVWASMYGAALVAVKDETDMKLGQILWNKMVVLTFLYAVILHTIWNFPITDLLVRFADVPAAYSLFYFLEVYYGKYIILIILAWIVNFKLLRKGIIQAITISEAVTVNSSSSNAFSPIPKYSNVSAVPQSLISVKCLGGNLQGNIFGLNNDGKIIFGRASNSTVKFPESTRGISGKHCEIKIKDGIPVLIDRESSYGTYLSDGTKLQPNAPCRIKNGMQFYLADKNNLFEIQM